MNISAVAVFSGGLDSTTMVYEALDRGIEIKRLVSFNYGQRHKKELEFASHTADRLSLHHSIIDLWSSGFTEALMTDNMMSALVDKSIDVPEGHYSEESMKATVVPNRNMIMLSIAGGIAVAENANTVLIGVHAGDHAIYPDCRPKFVAAASYTLSLANEGFGAFDMHARGTAITAPYIHDTKAQIARTAFKLGVPLHETWSCYKGGEIHCGRCGTCVERLEAIDEAREYFVNPLNKRIAERKRLDLNDYTKYEDSMYWKTAVN